jgi:hypothetical protein
MFSNEVLDESSSFLPYSKCDKAHDIYFFQRRYGSKRLGFSSL